MYQAVNVVGLDDNSLLGRPQMISGSIEDIFAENAFVAVKDSEFSKLENPAIGTEFELNDHRGVIVGTARVGSKPHCSACRRCTRRIADAFNTSPTCVLRFPTF